MTLSQFVIFSNIKKFFILKDIFICMLLIYILNSDHTHNKNKNYRQGISAIKYIIGQLYKISLKIRA